MLCPLDRATAASAGEEHAGASIPMQHIQMYTNTQTQHETAPRNANRPSTPGCTSGGATICAAAPSLLALAAVSVVFVHVVVFFFFVSMCLSAGLYVFVVSVSPWFVVRCSLPTPSWCPAPVGMSGRALPSPCPSSSPSPASPIPADDLDRTYYQQYTHVFLTAAPYQSNYARSSTDKTEKAKVVWKRSS